MHRGRRLGLPRQARQHGAAAVAAAGLADPVRTSDNVSFAEGQRPHQDQAMLSAVDAFRDQTGSPAGEDTMSGSSVASILIVDDDRRNLMALQELLQGLGQNLVLAHSGEEALRCVLKQEFAVILLDVDRKSTRLNSSHGYISYAVFCLKKKKQPRHRTRRRSSR